MNLASYEGMFDLSGKTAIVTGGSRGIGKASCLALAAFGADVVVTGVSDANQATADEINKTGGRSIFVRCDVSSVEQSRAAMGKAVAEFGRVDILVNNAGVAAVDPAEAVAEEEWDRVMSVNLRGLFFMSQAAARVMIERKKGGRIINIGSVFGTVGSEMGASVYHASKGGIVVLTRALACEWAKYGILVNAIGPGFIRTEMTKSIEESPELYQLLKDRHALKRFGTPDEVAGAVVFFASDASRFVTGQNLYVDGGYTAW
jgi:NAD(P)-dependent dehydrogenase (short-subunit alcohol dehydrogenase family)